MVSDASDVCRDGGRKVQLGRRAWSRPIPQLWWPGPKPASPVCAGRSEPALRL